MKSRKSESPSGASLGLIAGCAPLVFAIISLDFGARWETDAAVRGYLEPASVSSTVSAMPSAVLGKVFDWLPLGEHATRPLLLGALALGAAGYFAFRLTLHLLARATGRTGLDPWLALGASLSATLSLPFIDGARHLFGPIPAVALSLGLLNELIDPRPLRSVPRSLAYAACLGLLTAEAPGLGLALLVGGLPYVRRLTGPLFASSLLLFSLAWAVCWLPPIALGLVGPGRILDAAFGSGPGAPLFEILRSYGFLAILLAGIGAGLAYVGRPFSLFRMETGVGSVLVLVGFDLVLPQGGREIGREIARCALHLGAHVVLFALGTLGLRALMDVATALRLPGQRATRTLLAIFSVSIGLVQFEEAEAALGASPSGGPRIVTDEVLEQLPERSLLLGRSDALIARLRAAQARAERPDLLIVAQSELHRPELIRRLLQREPSLAGLLRELSVSGQPSELSFSNLADARPFFVEPDPTWNRRLLDHLEPGALVARVNAHAVGRSDRLAALLRSSPHGAGLVALGTAPEVHKAPPDRQSYEISLAIQRQLALSITAAGDAPAAEKTLALLAPSVVPAEAAPRPLPVLAAQNSLR